MATIHRFFDQSVVVSRMRDTGGVARAFSSTATVDGHIQEADRQTRQMLGLIQERAWSAWFDVDTDIKEGDKITDEAGTVYEVREITKKAYGVNQHLEVLLMEQSP